MNKRNLLIAIPALCSGYLHGQTQPASPNVIYILMDDLGYGDIGCFGQDKIETPHIDRLCSEGIKLTQHYSGSPVSAPARCVLMTGMHSGHAQIRFNNELAERGAVNNYDSVYVHKELEGQFPLQANTMTIGRMMQQAGYTTGCFGKWGIRVPKELPTNRGSTDSTDTIASASRTHTILLFCIMTKNVSTCPTK